MRDETFSKAKILEMSSVFWVQVPEFPHLATCLRKDHQNQTGEFYLSDSGNIGPDNQRHHPRPVAIKSMLANLLRSRCFILVVTSWGVRLP